MYKFELLLYLICSFSHELLCRHFPDGRNRDHPSHIVVVKLPTCLITQLLKEGVYFKKISPFWVRHHFIVFGDDWNEKNNEMFKGIAVLTGRGSVLPSVPAPWRMPVHMQRYPEPLLASHWLHGDRSQWTSSGCKRIKIQLCCQFWSNQKPLTFVSAIKISCVSLCKYELKAQYW